MKSKKANILTENIIFIALNLIFLTILFLFVSSRAETSGMLEEKYAKQIALILDAAEPGMEIHLNMEKAINEAEGNGWEEKIVNIEGNIVSVKLSEKGGYEYSFFNDIRTEPYPDRGKKEYVFDIE